MNKISILLISFLVLYSCKKTPKLEETLTCNKITKLNNLSSITDIKNNFTLYITINWKINFYYDNLQSNISTADTTKLLSKATIIDATL